jgi:hypothetical protein
VKRETFLLTDTTPVKGPCTFARLRELWDAGDISADSKLFLTERDDETNGVKCFALRAEDIKENLESGNEIDMDGLRVRVTAEIERSERTKSREVEVFALQDSSSCRARRRGYVHMAQRLAKTQKSGR